MPTGYEVARIFFETLLQSERLPPTELMDYQARLVAPLMRHAAAEVPYYARQSLPVEKAASDYETWLEIPTIDRNVLAHYGPELEAKQLPAGHGELRSYGSGGSTGAPIKVTNADLFRIAHVVSTYRLFAACGVDLTLPLYMIRQKGYASRWTDELIYRKWGYPWLPEDELGDRVFLDIETPPAEQLDRLAERPPAYVNTLPSNILRLVVDQRRTGKSPSVPVLTSVAEYLPPEVVAGAEKAFGSRVINILSSSEAGVIAIQCPESDMLHIQSELVLAEILNEDGRPCEEGEVGELVVTPLYNYAMPLIRYRSGDFVVKGGPCPCGRSLPTIKRFFGRKEHLFHYPDGSRALPPIDRVRICELIGHDAWQLVQVSRELAELRYESSPAMPEVAEAVRASVMEALAGLSVELKEVSAVPKTSGGKRHFTVNAKW